MASDSWYYAKDGQQLGPVTTATLQGMLASGQISGQDLIWKEGMSNWEAAGSVSAINPNAGYGVAQSPYPPQTAGYNQPASNPQSGYAPQQGHPPQGYAPQGHGQPIGYQSPMPNMVSPYQGKATTAMILSIVGLFCFGIILGPIALVMGIGALNGMKATGDDRGKGMATAAIIIGSIDIVLFFVGIAMMFGG